MEEIGWDRRKVLHALRRAHEEDYTFENGEILGSMCTDPHPVARDAHCLFLETNLGDPGHFPGVAQMEREVLGDLLALTHAPKKAAGRFLSGGTEANLLALYVARETTGRKQVVVPDSAHFSFEKAARLLGMTLKRVPTGRDGRADPVAMAKAVTKQTALMVGVAGTTELGLVDPIKELAAVAKKARIGLHVDAAFGGYVIPFLEEAGHVARRFDFRLPGVTSISIDPHKMGMATIPGGALLLRDRKEWDHIAVETPYVSTSDQSSLLGTRSGAAVAATWAVHRHLGLAGFESVVETCLDNTVYLAARLEERDIPLVQPPELNVVTFRVGDPETFAEAMETKGFRVNIVPRFDAVRIVVNPHVTRHVLERFLTALDEVLGDGK